MFRQPSSGSCNRFWWGWTRRMVITLYQYTVHRWCFDFLQGFRGASPPPGTGHEAGESETKTKRQFLRRKVEYLWVSDYPRRTQNQSAVRPSHGGVPATKRCEGSPYIDLWALPHVYPVLHQDCPTITRHGQRRVSTCLKTSRVGYSQFLSWSIPTFNRDS